MTDNERIRLLEQQNDLMLSAFGLAVQKCTSCGGAGVIKDTFFDKHYDSDCIACRLFRDTIAQVKALTVSKQEESTVSEVACEQPTKDSLHVARQNKPTHPTEQINRLAAEVATDMQRREGEQK